MLTEEQIREMAAYYADKYRCFVGDKYDHDAEVDAATLVQICDRVLEAEAEAAEYKASLNATHQAHVATQARVKVLEQSEIVGREVLLPVKREQSLRLMQHAEATGYRKGVEDAVRLAREHRARVPNHHPDEPMDDLVAQGYGNAALNLECAILALLDKPNPERRNERGRFIEK